MDLYAFTQIEDLDEIAKINNISIPRLRGYRLMKDEEPITQKDFDEMFTQMECEVVRNLCCSHPVWTNSGCFSYGSALRKKADGLIETKIVKEEDGKEYEVDVRVKWELLHGKKLKLAKRLVKEAKQKILDQYEVWNKYVGRPDVLYIHSRMGGYNWECYEDKQEILNAPWFLERVDDHYDNTYCDFYAKIKTDI